MRRPLDRHLGTMLHCQTMRSWTSSRWRLRRLPCADTPVSVGCRPGRWTASLVIALAMSLNLVTVARAEPAPGFVSVMFGRMQWTTTNQMCRPLPNAIDLGTAKRALDSRGIRATGVVITSWTAQNRFRCRGGTTKVPGWNKITAWHADGWSFVSGGTHADMTKLTYVEQWRESCRSLRVFARHGIDASGMFAYGNNRYTDEIQADPVSRCFRFGRRYSGYLNHRSTAAPLWYAHVHSVNGGKCNDPTLACYTKQYASPRRYWSPLAMAARIRAVEDTWYVLQFYRFVRRSHAGARHAWDCTSDDWRRHFTSHSELYCYRDFLLVMDALKRAMTRGVVVTDPGSVADAWGRST